MSVPSTYEVVDDRPRRDMRKALYPSTPSSSQDVYLSTDGERKPNSRPTGRGAALNMGRVPPTKYEHGDDNRNKL